jgi:cysteate synthase
MSARHYALRCPVCGRTTADDGLLLRCPEIHEPALLRAEFLDRRFEPDPASDGIFRYRRWLPAARPLAGAGRSVTFRSERLARMIGLRQLWVVFNGYWPERGATLDTATFKELEAWTVLARLPDDFQGTLVVASAGNTAAAFARTCSRTGTRCLIVVPETALPALRFGEPLAPCVRIVALGEGADYSDATALAEAIAQLDGFVAEGGVRNIGRRAGLGTTLLAAVEAIGRLPDYYFQAVGSGAGGIGVFETAELLVADGRYGDRPPRLMLSQNLPFVPLYDSWKTGRRELVPIDPDEGRRRIAQISASVLSNRQPPYAVGGGVYDALTATQGDMLVATNDEAAAARRLFEDLEGIDIDPAGAVALATLRNAARDGAVHKDAMVLLNITGGGRQRRCRERRQLDARPALRLRRETRRSKAVEQVAAL